MKYDYDIAIIGGGSGGLVAASSTAQLGLKVLLVEKERLGGDCLWYGCVPSKALISVAKRIHGVKNTTEMGLPSVGKFQPKFADVMKRMRDVQATIQPHDSPERFRGLGADVQFGSPAFVSNHELLLNNKRITFKYAIIATGSGPRVPDIPGLHKTGYLTNVDVFSIKQLPKNLIVIGGGPIGTELAQTFQRFGSNVTVLVRSALLPREDPALVAQLQKNMEAEGVSFIFGKSPVEVGVRKGKKYVVLKDKRGKKTTMACDDIVLIATGRVPNTEGLQLEQAGVEHSRKGIAVDEYLRTTAKNIYAVGDVTGGFQFTHMAASHASTAVRNIITPVLKSKAEKNVVPWVTYTDPELARVGLTAAQAKEQGVAYEELVFPFSANDRAIAQGETTGEIRAVVSPKGKILGASILGPDAGELIMEYTIAMKHNLSIKDLAATIHPYPTLSGASWSVAGSFYKKFLTERTKKITQFLVRKL